MMQWRSDEHISGKTHPDFPDDIQVVVHDGSFRFSDGVKEIMWASIKGVHDKTIHGHPVYKAVLINQPHKLKSVTINQPILLVAYKDYQYAVYITPEYLNDRNDYIIIPCNNCGLPEAFDPIPKLFEHSFSATHREANDDVVIGLPMFSSFCPMCGQVLIIKHRDLKLPDSATSLQENPPSPKSPDTLWDKVKGWLNL